MSFFQNPDQTSDDACLSSIGFDDEGQYILEVLHESNLRNKNGDPQSNNGGYTDPFALGLLLADAEQYDGIPKDNINDLFEIDITGAYVPSLGELTCEPESQFVISLEIGLEPGITLSCGETDYLEWSQRFL